MYRNPQEKRNSEKLEKMKVSAASSVGRTGQSLKIFLKNLSDLQHLTFQRLVTTVEEDNSKQDFLKDIKSKEEKANSEASKLGSNLSEQRTKYEKEYTQRSSIISKLKGKIFLLFLLFTLWKKRRFKK